ncbi:hypothetical protein ACP70R_012680 [Stipagrostis hirtigluma subsp. patula]
MSFRRFVYLATDDCKWRDFVLRRIDMSRFFLPSDLRDQLFPGPPEVEFAHLPPPEMRFSPVHPRFYKGSMNFMLLGRDKVLAADNTGRTLLYDPEFHSVRTMPSLTQPKHMPASLNVGGNLYILDTAFHGKVDPKLCFEGLTFEEDGTISGHRDWHSYPLPPPPYVDAYSHGVGEPCHISSYAVVDGPNSPNIWISNRTLGTHSFDTAARSWTKAGDWVLPFSGHAQYAPELKLWFGLRSSDYCDTLCASDLTATPPKMINLWKDPAPQVWVCRSSYLVHLGCSKFCLAKFFSIIRDPESLLCDRFVEFSGIEVIRSEAEGDAGVELRVEMHRAEVYSLVDKLVHWVL